MMLSLYFHSAEQQIEAKRISEARQKNIEALINQKSQRQLPPVTILYYAPVSRFLGKHMLVSFINISKSDSSLELTSPMSNG